MLTTRSMLLTIVLVIFSNLPLHAADTATPGTNSAVTFLYYKDLAAAEDFYGNILGLKLDFDGGWVKIFRISDGGRVGLVDEAKGYLNTAVDKPVMLSVDTSDIHGWYKRIKQKAANYIVKDMKEDEAEGFVTGFLLKDTEGYHVEFFQWNEGHKKY